MVKGRLITILVVVILASMAYMSMWFFYADVVDEYSDDLNFTVDDSFNKTFVIMEETLDIAGADMTATHQDYLNTTGGTETTASDKMILNSFGVVKDFLVNSFSLIIKMTTDVVKQLKIPTFWQTGFIAIILVVIIITIVAGFFKITTW